MLDCACNWIRFLYWEFFNIGRILLAVLLVLIVLAKLCGEHTPTGIAEWVTYRIEELLAMKLLSQPKAPCHMTYRRILQLIVSPEELERLVSEYHQSCLNKSTRVVFSLDGKTVRGTIPSGESRGTRLLSLYMPGQGLVLMQARVAKRRMRSWLPPKSWGRWAWMG